MPYLSTKNDTRQLSLTIYNDGFGLVKETREMNLSEEDLEIRYLDVAEKIETDSIVVDGLDIQELNYEFDLVSKEKLLEKYIDQKVYIYDPETKEKTEYRLLSVGDGMVVENTATREIVINPEGELTLPKLPSGLIVKPGLVWKIKPSAARTVHVYYITKGFSWNANYVLNLKGNTFDLSGWVSINNHSGATFENSRLKLLAGDVKRVNDHFDLLEMPVFSRPRGRDRLGETQNIKEKSFQDYHLYSFNETTTLKNQQSKQMNFLKIDQVPFRRYYEYSLYDEDKPKIIIEFVNKESEGLGIPLPKGKVKVYSEDPADGSMELIGEEGIDHTAVNEKLTLHIGKAFDINCEGKKVNSYKKKGYQYEQFVYTVRNNKQEKIRVKINHDFCRENWEIVDYSDPYVAEDSGTILFWAEVEPEESKTIEFKYRIPRSIQVNVNDEE
ncbi:DUF4139 domain-containing protein [Paenactinomyces guangxiensis]|uniref:DUF4139 domain-containing protein n=1 Tax=Paenactinomyces guangxiensis TaxID=1490290 RepID=A0A7W1WPW6_9BACL|nr:DUF4139 domain-containing protein [Paenactinomyces guangxiensis]MBA4493884.1 DUF4139 domain-containing protein [Paenactinomyces guangxiensis]MBH8591350.1 DUF4139 domain-containing protein [Paenactinomyces guangxiensis]